MKYETFFDLACNKILHNYTIKLVLKRAVINIICVTMSGAAINIEPFYKLDEFIAM